MENFKTSAILKLLIISFSLFILLFPHKVLSETISFKVIIIAMYEEGEITGGVPGEAQLWYERDSLFLEMNIIGANSPLYYNKKGQGLIITGIGPANASSTIMALGLNKNLDLKNTYFIVAGIAGTSPNACTIGSAIWTEWIVDAGLCFEIDAREIPEDWKFSRFRLRCNEPWCEDGATVGTEVFRLDSILIRRVYDLTKKVKLADSQHAKLLRAKYPKKTPARKKPTVSIGDNIAGSTFFFGKIKSEWADWWIKMWTNNSGKYCTTNMEDSGTLTAFKRLSDANIISYRRIMVLRTISNFDQPYPGKSAIETINIKWAGNIAIENAYRVGSVVAHDIVNNWDTWNDDNK